MTDNSLDFRLFLEALPGSILILKPDAPHYTIVAANDDVLRITNKLRQEVVGKSIFEVYPENPDEITATGPSHIKTSLDTVCSTKKQNRLPVVRYDVLNVDGVFEARYWSPLHKPILDEEGEVSYIIHAPVEVTDQIHAEKKQQDLGQIEKTYNLLLQAPVAVFIVSGPEHIVELANDEMLKILGKTPEIIGKAFFDSLPDLASQEFPELLNRVRKTGTPYHATEFPARQAFNGSVELRYYNFIYQPYYANPGDKMPTGVICVAHNVTEQVLSRKKLEESAFRFRSLIEQTPVPTSLLKGREFIIEVANEAMIAILGKGDSVLGKSLFKAAPELENQGFQQVLNNVFTSGIAYEEKSAKAIVEKDGVPGTYYFDYSYKPLINADGEVYAVINAAVDVTDKVLAEKQLEEEKAYLQNAIDIGELGTFKVDLIRDTGTYSETIRQWFGLPDLIQPMEVIVSKTHPDDTEKVREVIEKTNQSEKDARHDIIYKIFDADGKIRHLRSIGKTIFTNGQPTSINGLIQDVSVQVNAQLRLQESESRFRSMIQQAPIGICLTRGRDVVYESINTPMMQIIGKGNADEVLGKKIADVVPGITTQPVFMTVVNVFDTGVPYNGSEFPIQLMKDGRLKTYYFNLSYTPMLEDGKITSVLHVAIDVTEQVRARQKLEENEQFIRSVVESAPYPIAVYLGQEMKIQLANQAIKDAWGKGDNVEGKLFTDILPEFEGQQVFDQLKEAFTSGKPFYAKNQRLELVIAGKLESFYFNYSFTPLLDAAGNVYGVINTGVDVTDLNQARQAIEVSEARFRNMVQQAPVAILLLRSTDLIIEVANDPMLQFMDKDETVINRKLLDVLPELKDNPIISVILKIFETGEPFIGLEVPATINVKGGTRLGYYNLTYTPLIEAGVVTGILEVATEVTEQVLARKKLEESQEELKRFKFMADQARDAFLLIREDGTFAYLNAKALESWGYTVEEAQSLLVPDIDPNYNIDLFSLIFAQAQKGIIPIVNTLHKRKDGSVFPIEASLSMVVISGEPHLFGVGRDITERKLAEEALEQKNAQLIRINNDLDNFIYTASHDLKAPILNIEALLDALRWTMPEERPESEALHITNLMQKSVDRFKKTIANLTEIVKLQKENNEAAVSVNLNEVIGDVLLDLEPLIQSSGAVVEINVADCPGIHFSQKNLRSVVYNLLSNGIKYHFPDRPPKLEVSCKKLPDFHVLTVSDNGLGLKENQVEKLFSMFKRFHDHVEGTGIGLYMVKKMVENVGGHIEVESTEDVGTTFRVFFPI